MNGVDYPINEPSPFYTLRFYHTFNGSGLCYKVVVAHETGNIFWVHGPFHYGANPDISIFEGTLLLFLKEEESIENDNEWGQPKLINKSTVHEYLPEGHRRIHARHENVNERLKNFMLYDIYLGILFIYTVMYFMLWPEILP